MISVIVSSEEEIEAQLKAKEEIGLRFAAISNTGLPKGSWRMTFLPKEAFANGDFLVGALSAGK